MTAIPSTSVTPLNRNASTLDSTSSSESVSKSGMAVASNHQLTSETSIDRASPSTIANSDTTSSTHENAKSSTGSDSTTTVMTSSVAMTTRVPTAGVLKSVAGPNLNVTNVPELDAASTQTADDDIMKTTVPIKEGNAEDTVSLTMDSKVATKETETSSGVSATATMKFSMLHTSSNVASNGSTISIAEVVRRGAMVSMSSVATTSITSVNASSTLGISTGPLVKGDIVPLSDKLQTSTVHPQVQSISNYQFSKSQYSQNLSTTSTKPGLHVTTTDSTPHDVTTSVKAKTTTSIHSSAQKDRIILTSTPRSIPSSSVLIKKLTTSQSPASPVRSTPVSSSSSGSHASTLKFNSTLNGTETMTMDGSVNYMALYISLSLVLGLGIILAILAIVFCLLRNYCQQFHRCCSKHSGHCKLANSCPCVENHHYRGLHPQRLTETPDLISESVHAHMTRIRRGSNSPDQIALLERSMDDQHSLNELDQFVFEDPDLTPTRSDLFIDSSRSNSSSRGHRSVPTRSNRDSSDEQSECVSPKSESAGRGRSNLVGACFGLPEVERRSSKRVNWASEDRSPSDYGRDCAATVVENPYLRPSCHAHPEPGPNWRPFHPYDPVYIPHHDPIGMQRRLDKDGNYVTSPRLRMKQRLYEEVQANAGPGRLLPAVPHRNTGGDSSIAPLAPMRTSSSRQSPVVPLRSTSLQMSNVAPPMRVSSRSSTAHHNPEKNSDVPSMTGPRSTLRPSPAVNVELDSINVAATRTKAIVDPVLDRCLPEPPPITHDLSMLSFSGGQRDSTSSSATIPGHEYSRVDFGTAGQGSLPIVTTAEVEMYETDSDSCRDGAYESIDFPKNPPPL